MQKPKKSFLPPQTLLFVGMLLLQACGGGGSGGGGNRPPPLPPVDTTPAAFNFAGRINVVPDTLIESGPVVISAISGPAPISVTGGEYSIEGGAYASSAGTVANGQTVRIRVQSPAESAGSVSATLSVGSVSAAFTVVSADFDHRTEAEDATLTGGASTVADDTAWNDEAVFAGSVSHGVSITNSMDAGALIIAYRTDAAGTLAATVNGVDAGEFTLHPTDGAYATASVVASVNAGDVVAIVNETSATATETYIDYVDFAASPFRFVSTVADTKVVQNDGASVGPNGDIYVSGGPNARNISSVTPNGDVSVFATGFGSANGSYFDSSGNLYVADYQSGAVRKITPGGVMSTFASSLNGPAGVWVDANDNVLVSLFGANFSGTGAAVLSITPSGVVSTYAQGGGLQDVIGIVGDENGNVYASNWASGNVYEITGGVVDLLAQTGSNLNMICYSNGYIYAPSPAGAKVQRVSLTGVLETFIAPSTGQPIDGPIGNAGAFAAPNACAFSADGTVFYVTDRDTGLLRKVDAGAP